MPGYRDSNLRSLCRLVGLFIFTALVLAAPALALPALVSETTLTPADPSRDAIDIGGTWNGTTEVTATTGDGFTLVIRNLADPIDPLRNTAYDVSITATLPTGFLYVAGTIAGPPGTTASQSGTTLTIALPPDTDLLPGASLEVSYGLTTEATLTSGSKPLVYDIVYGTADGLGDASLEETQAVQVYAGASTIRKTPNEQTRAVNETASWDVIVTNTGLGGLFDVVIDESFIDPNPAGSLQVTGMTQTSPASPLASGTVPAFTLPYLAPGESFVMRVEAQVLDCLNINNRAETTDRTAETANFALAQVLLDLEQPLIDFAPPAAALAYTGAVPVSFPVVNTGLGDAENIRIDTNFETLGVTVAVTSPDWSYDAATGVFTLTRDGGRLGNLATVDLAYTLDTEDSCAERDPEVLVVWEPSYTNTCGAPYEIPFKTSSLADAADRPSVTLTKGGVSGRLEVGEPARWLITLDASNRSLIATDPLQVVDVIPLSVTDVVVGSAPAGTSVSCSGTCQAGDTLTWSVPLAALSGPLQLEIAFTAPADPCLAGTFLENVASVAALSTRSCDLSASDDASTLLGTNPNAEVEQSFNAGNPVGAAFETGAADDGDATREPGEGEFIPFVAVYGFGTAYPGSWGASTYTDDFSALPAQSLVPGSLTIAVDGGSPQSVPAASITSSTGSLVVDLSFVAGAGFAGDPNVAGHTIRLEYLTSVPDAEIPLPGTTRNMVQRATLRVTDGTGSGACVADGNGFTQGAFLSVSRAAAQVVLDMPQAIEICEEFPVTLTVGNATEELASRVLTTLLTAGDYEYVTGQTPLYGGSFGAGSVAYSENGGIDPSWELLPEGADLTTPGTIQVNLRRKALTPVAPSPSAARVDYDDEETSLTALRDFSAEGNTAPAFVFTAKLSLTVTPQEYAITSNRGRWLIYVTNGGQGAAYGATLEDVVPAGLVPNEALTNIENPTHPVTIAGSTMSWSLGDIASGQTVVIGVVVDVDGTTCSIPADSNQISARWGCQGVDHERKTSSDPDFTFPAGQLQVTHLSIESAATLCENDQATIVVRNTGVTHLYDVIATEDLRTAATGIAFVPGTVTYSTNGGLSWSPGGDPVGDPLTWTATEIPALADLAPRGEQGLVSEVRIRFGVAADERANGPDTEVVAGGQGSRACGDVVSAPSDAFSMPVNRPEITLRKTARNVTAGQSAFSESIVAFSSETVEYRIEIQNQGDGIARHVRLLDLFPATGGGNRTLTLPDSSTIPMPDGTPVSLPDIGARTTETFVITEQLGSVCVTEDNTASVTWGCVDNGASIASNLSSPVDNEDTATLVMRPDFSEGGIEQSITDLPNGRAEISITLTNQGGRAETIEVADTLIGGYAYDGSFTPTLGGTASGVTLATDASNPALPTFTISGAVDDGETVVVTFRVLPAGGFDTTSDPLVNPETEGNALDPVPPASGENVIDVAATSSCSAVVTFSDSLAWDPQTPDVDIAIDPATRVVADGDAISVAITITNVGDLGSVAEAIDLRALVGSAITGAVVTVTTPGAGGTGGVCAGGVCAVEQIGSLAAGAAAVITVAGTASDAGGSLAVDIEVEASLRDSAGADTGFDLSFDEAKPKLVGFSTQKTVLSSSESFTDGSTGAIGEEVTFRLRGRWFGGEALSSIVVRDSLPAGLGFVSQVATAANTVTISGVTAPTPVASGRVEFAVADIGTGEGTFEVDLVARVLNVAENADGTDLTNNLGHSFEALGTTFASDDADDGFGGSEPRLHAEATVSVARPTLDLDKQVRNITAGGGFTDAGAGDAGDVFEYRIVLANAGGAPLFECAIADTLGTAKLALQDGATDGIDNDGDGSIDEGSEGTFTPGAAGSVAFDDANTGLAAGDPSATFARLDPGQSLTVVYRAVAQASVTPNEVLPNGASGSGSTLPGASGSQTAPQGTPGAESGEALFSNGDQADVTVTEVDLAKLVFSTSVGADASTDVLVGEQVLFEVRVVLPEGTVPNFVVTDRIPENLTLLSTPPVTIGSAIGGAQPTITPSTLPASGDPLVVTWDFGTRLVGTGTEEERTVVVTYLTQVRNTTRNVNNRTFVNEASYTFDGSPQNLSPVTLTVREPAINITKRARNNTRGNTSFNTTPTPPDAGDRIEYRIQIRNGSAFARSYDHAIRDTLPVGFAYVPGTTAGAFTSDPDVTGSGAPGDPQTLVWGRTQSTPLNVDINTSSTTTFRYQVVALLGVEPSQALPNDAVTDWTSLDGDPGPDLGTGMGTPGTDLGERTGQDGAGGLNDFLDASAITITSRDEATLSKTLAAGTVGQTSFRVGELLTFTLALGNVPEGTTDALVVTDTLPADLVFVETVSIGLDGDGSPWTAASPFTYAALVDGVNAPAAGATGSLVWSFGTLVNDDDNDGSNDALTIVYRARVATSIGEDATTSLTNGATLDFQLASGDGAATRTDARSFDVVQPVLAHAKTVVSAPDPLGVGDTVRYRLTVTNSGAAPAYDIVVSDTLPLELRDALPANFAYTIDGVVPTTSPAFDASTFATTGLVSWTWPSSEPLAGAGSTLTIEYDAVVDADVGPGVEITNVSRTESAHSLPSTDPQAGSRKSYGPTAESETTLTTDAPDGVSKTGSVGAAIGETVTYTVTFPSETVDAVLYDVVLTDDLPANLALLSVDESTASGATGYDGSATSLPANHVEARFDTVPAGSRAVITITARVVNDSGNQAGVVVSNTTSALWAKSDGATPEPAFTDDHDLTLLEPDVSATKRVRNISRGDSFGTLTAPDAGDVLEYQVALTNPASATTSTAFDLAITDSLPEGLAYVPLSMGGGLTSEPEASGTGTPGDPQVLTWGRTQTTPVEIDLSPGGALTFTYRVLVLSTVEPRQALDNSVQIDWTSLDGDGPNVPGESDGERIGSGTGPNDYVTGPVVAPATSREDYGLTKTRTSDTYEPADDDVRIGDRVTFTLRLRLQEGLTRAVRVQDQLPAGLAFVRTISIDGDATAPYESSSPFAYASIPASATPDASAAGVSGALLTWDLGDVTNGDTDNGVDDEIVVVYEVRTVAGVLGAATSTRLANEARLDYELASGLPGTSPTDSEAVDALQPRLGISKEIVTTPSPIEPGAEIRYRLTITNTGLAPAYDATATDTLPDEVRDSAVSAIAHAIGGVPPATTPAFDDSAQATSGVVSWTLDSGDPIPPGGAWTIEYTVTIDADAESDVAITNLGAIGNHASLPLTDPNAADRETYTSTETASTTLRTFDEPTDFAKDGPASAAPGETITFTLVFPETPVQSALADVRIEDVLPGELALVSIDPGTANGGLGYDDSLSDPGTNTAIVTFTSIPAGAQARVAITARVRADAPANQAGAEIVNSSSVTFADGPGGTVLGPIEDDATVLVIEPALSALKSGRNATAGDEFGTITAPDAGDALLFRIVVTNAAGGDAATAFDVAISDVLPAGVAYDGMIAATLDGASLLPLEPSGAPDGPLTWGRNAAQDIDMAPGAELVLVYRVVVRESARPLETLRNSVTADYTSLDGPDTDERDGDGGSGGLDDYATPEASVTASVPDTASLVKRADAGSLPGGEYRAGDVVTYTLSVESIPEGTSASFLVADTLPEDMEFVETVSIHEDGDGSPFAASAPFAFTDLVAGVNAPDAGATGAVSWNFGTLVNAGDNSGENDTLVIVYRARVKNSIAATPPSVSRTNAATLDYATATGPATQRADSATITVLQPALSVAKETVVVPSPVQPGAVVTYRITVTNDGQAPAFGVVVRDVLPEQARDTALASLAYTIGGTTPGTPPALDESARATTGEVFWTWPDSEPLAPSAALTITFDATLDADVVANEVILNSAFVDDSFSLDGSTPTNLAERKSYGEVGPATVSLTSFDAPEDLSKTGPATASPGESVTFTLAFPGTAVKSELFDVTITDLLPSDLELVSVVEGPGSAGLGYDGSATDPLTNQVSVSFTSIPAGAQALVSVTARVLASDADNQSGHVITNTASATYAASAGGPPQMAILGAHDTRVVEPEVTIAKAGRNHTRGDAFGTITAPDAGDVLEYRLTIANAAGADSSTAFDVAVNDAIPAGVAFSAMTSALLDGASLLPLDPAGAPDGPLVWGRANGQDIDIAPGSALVLTYRVVVRDTVLVGEDLTNSARADFTSQDGDDANERDGDGGSGGLDDYVTEAVFVTTTVPDESTLTKTASAGALADGAFRVGELVTYTLTIDGLHEGESPKAVVRDTLPANMEFVETLQVHQDLDGSPFAPSAPFTYTALAAGSTAPAEGATGAIAWDFGTLVNDGDGDLLTSPLVIVYTARIKNTIPEADTSDLTNAATFDFDTASGPATTRTASDTVTVLQPRLAIAKELVAEPDPVVAGAVIRYRVTVTNEGLAPAYDVVVSDTLPETLRDTEPANIAYTINGIEPSTPPVFDASALGVTGVLTWTWPDSEPLLAASTMTIEYDVTIDADIGANVSIVNSARVVDSFSLDASTPEQVAERKSFGEEGPVSAPVVGTSAATDMGKTGPATAAIGESISYVLTVPGTPVGVTLYDVAVTDVVPSNVDVLEVRVEGDIDGTAETPPFFTDNTVGVTLPAIPADGQAIVTIVARVLDAAVNTANPPTSFDNQGSFTYADAPGGTTVGTIESPVHAISIVEPALRAAKSGPATLDIGATGTFTVEATNVGTATAWQTTIVDVLPEGMRDVAPVIGTISVGAAARTLSDTAPDDYDVSWDGSAGTLSIALKSTAARIDAGETLTVVYDAVLDFSAVDGATLTNSASITRYASQDGSTGVTPETRISTNVAGTGTPADGDDFQADHVLTVRAPILRARKAVDLREAGPGDLLSYSVTLVNSGTIDATDATFSDELDAAFEPDTLADVLSTSGSVSFDGSGGVNGTGAFTVTGITIPTGGAVTISYTARLRAVLASGTVARNQGVLRVPDLDDLVTDSTADEDDDGTENGNDPDDPDDDDPTTTTVSSAPLVEAVKTALDVDGGLFDPTDEVLYTIVVTNTGTEHARDVAVRDAIPADTTYVAGSTTQDGALVDDVAGTSALASGLTIGRLEVGASVTITFRVQIDALVPAATIIANQAFVSGEGENSGPFEDEPSDDPDTPADDDPTLVQTNPDPGPAGARGSVWFDADHDRVQDAGERGGEGWIVELVKDGVVVATTTTDADGDYEFADLEPGAGYGIRFRHPETNVVWGRPVSSAPGASTDNGTIENLTLPAGATIVDQDLPLDPSGVVYDAITREPVPGAVVSISGPPGFDPAEHLLAGQQGQTTAADGLYRFDLIGDFPPGSYTIAVVPPAGYISEWPSTILPPQTGALDPSGLADPLLVAPQNGAPSGSDPTTYYVTLVLQPGDPDVVNNHLPVDPFVDGAIQVRKTTPVSDVSYGSLVPYTISALNTLSSTLTSISLEDQIPPGFKYVSGTATIDGVPAEPIVAGRQLTWSPLTFAPAEEKTIKLVLVVGAGVGEGVYVNQAWAQQALTSAVISNVATASVRVVADPTFDCSDVIGRVFDDRNANGYPDEGEPGVADVRLVTVRGLLVTTDAEGRYHVTCPEIPHESRGSNFVMKLDTRSLPAGFRVTSENPRVVRLTRGKIARLDFGVSVQRVIRLELSAGALRDDGREATADLERAIAEAVTLLREAPSVLRIAYLGSEGETEFAKRALAAVEERILDAWRTARDGEERGQDDAGNARPTLVIEREHVVLQSDARHPGPWADADLGDNRPVTGERYGIGPIVFESPSILRRPIEPNTESVFGASGAGGKVFAIEQPFRLVVDGNEGGRPSNEPVDLQRRADVDAARAAVEIRYDAFLKERRLSVTAWPRSFTAGAPVSFRADSNYAVFIRRAEMRLFRAGDSPSADPFLVLPFGDKNVIAWTPDEGAPEAITYVLRVYDRSGRFDETVPQKLPISREEHPSADAEATERELLAGYGESRLALRNIPLEGGTITVSGRDVEKDARVSVMGTPVPLDARGRFAGEQILPPGRHAVRVSVMETSGQTTEVERTVFVPKDDWFLVGLADLTVGQTSVRGPAALVTADEDLDDGDVFVDGRVALYLKGKIKGEYLLTAALDTREEPLDQILGRLDEKDPRQLLRRLDPDRYYPVYGDDSTTLEDAPTQGRFYVRLERGDSHVLWGNFHTKLTDTDLAQIDRGLYGALVHVVSPQQTSFGERRFAIDAFAAEPETVQAREEFRGTGGSLYYLAHRDITIGSDRVRVEIRDKDSGLVLETRSLIANRDYDIDPIQGRLMLTEPLPSTADDGLVVRDGAIAGHPVYVVVRYEYAPLFGELDDMAVGGRAAGWVGEHLQLGVTGSDQEVSGETQSLYGADATLRIAAGTYLKLEGARSEGQALSSVASLDGGFFFTPGQRAGTPGEDAFAYRVEAAADLADLGGSAQGKARLYWQDQDSGFSAPGQLSLRQTTLFGAAFEAPLAKRWTLGAKADSREEDGGPSRSAAQVDLGYAITERWSALLGVRHDDWDDDGPGSSLIVATGSPYESVRRLGARTDAALQVGYKTKHDWDVYGFAQGTLERDGTRTPNNRYGLGAKWKLSDRLTLGAEASGGNGGVGGKVDTDFHLSDRTNVYLAYALDTDRSDTGLRGRNGTLTTGVRTRFSETISVFGEERYLHGEGRSGLTHAFGMDLAPWDRWKLGLTAEFGKIEDPLGGELDRDAAGVSAGYTGEKVKAASALEARRDEGAGATRTTWLMRNTLSYQVRPAWRALAKLNLSMSESTQGEFYDGDFTEGILGFAYRPQDDDRLDALFKYTFFEDLPTSEQKTRTNQRIDYSQRSHVLSADATFGLTKKLSLGGKYAFRIGELSSDRGQGPWVESQAQLAIARVDWHVVRQWDVLAEVRWLDVDLAGDTRSGALLAIYRQLGRNAKVGIGYNFTDFSDDLTDLDYDEEGWFFNVVGTF